MPRDQPDDAPDKEEAVRQRCQAFEERVRAKYLDLLQRKNDAARQFESAKAQLGQAVTAHDEWRQELQQKHAARLEEKAKAAKSLVQQHEQSKQRARPQDVPEHRAWEYFGANCRGLSDSFQIIQPRDIVEPQSTWRQCRHPAYASLLPRPRPGVASVRPLVAAHHPRVDVSQPVRRQALPLPSRSTPARMQRGGPLRASGEEEPTPGVKKNTEFGYSRKDILLIGLGFLALGYGMYYGLQATGMEAGMAGSWVQLIVILGMMVGWLFTYLFRVANKEMTYVQQLEDYETAVMARRMEEMPESELENMLEELEAEKARKAAKRAAKEGEDGECNAAFVMARQNRGESPWNKKALIGSLIISTLICAPLLYVPYLSTKVSKHYRGSWEWGMIICMGVTLMGLCEIYQTAADAAA
eukprot:jgi/Tetstr1/424971/TSEL_001505.t1